MAIRNLTRLRAAARDVFGLPAGPISGRCRGLSVVTATLRALPVPDLVLPGHPREETEPQSPCLSQQAWEELLDQGIRDVETLLARFKADGANFLDDKPKRLLPDLYYLGNFRGAAIYAFFAA